MLIELGMMGKWDVQQVLLWAMQQVLLWVIPAAARVPGDLDHLLEQNCHQQFLRELANDFHQLLVPLPLFTRAKLNHSCLFLPFQCVLHLLQPVARFLGTQGEQLAPLQLVPVEYLVEGLGQHELVLHFFFGGVVAFEEGHPLHAAQVVEGGQLRLGEDVTGGPEGVEGLVHAFHHHLHEAFLQLVLPHFLRAKRDTGKVR